jgi:hypothetical protein
MSCAAWTVIRKRAIQYLSIMLCKNSLLLVLECLLSTPCLHLRSLHTASRAMDLENVCFLEVVLPENWVQLYQSGNHPFVGLTNKCHIHTANISSFHGLCLSEFIITMTFPSSEVKQKSIHGPKFICYSNVRPREQLQKQTGKSS